MISILKGLSNFWLLCMLLFISCSEDDSPSSPAKSKVSFEINLIKYSTENLRQISTRYENIAKVYLTISTKDGVTTPFNRSSVEYSKDGTSLIIENIELPVGEFFLKELLIEDYTGYITYASPMAESKLGDEIPQPLPLGFTVLEGTSNPTEIQAIATRGLSFLDFGIDGDEFEFKDEANCDGGVYHGDLSFTVQEQIDEFASFCYSEIKGNLSIRTSPHPVDLSPLKSLKSVDGMVSVFGIEVFRDVENTLTSLEGLHNLEYAETLGLSHLYHIQSLEGLRGLKETVSINMDNIPNVKNLKGLENLEKCRLFRVTRLENLENLAGLSSLSKIETGLHFYRMPKLSSLQGAESLTHIGQLVLSGVDKITSLEGIFEPLPQEIESLSINLSKLTDLRGLFSENLKLKKEFSIDSNELLETLDGLYFEKDLERVAIRRNEKLSNITALSGLNSIERNLIIERNDNLENLSGLESLETINGNFQGPLRITQNPNLVDFCGLTPFFQLHPNFDAVIEENAFNPLPADVGKGDCSLD